MRRCGSGMRDKLAAARAPSPAPPSALCADGGPSAPAICSPMRKSGSSEVIGSWKIMVILRPRMRVERAWRQADQFHAGEAHDCRSPCRLPPAGPWPPSWSGSCRSRIPRRWPAFRRDATAKLAPLTASTDAVMRVEADAQVLDRQHRFGHLSAPSDRARRAGRRRESSARTAWHVRKIEGNSSIQVAPSMLRAPSARSARPSSSTAPARRARGRTGSSRAGSPAAPAASCRRPPGRACWG